MSGPWAIPASASLPSQQLLGTRTHSPQLFTSAFASPLLFASLSPATSPTPCLFHTSPSQLLVVSAFAFWSSSVMLPYYIHPRALGIGALSSQRVSDCLMSSIIVLSFWWPYLLNCFLASAAAWCCCSTMPWLHLQLLQPVLPMMKTRSRQKAVWETLLMLLCYYWQRVWSLSC